MTGPSTDICNESCCPSKDRTFGSKNKPVVFRVFNSLSVGGVTSRLQQVLPLLMDEFEVHMVTYRKEGVLGPEFRKMGIHVHHIPLPGKWSPLGLLKLSRLFREYKADIVHTHAFGGNISGILAAAMARVPIRIGQVHTRQQHWYGKTALHRKKQAFEEYCVHTLFSRKVLFPSMAAQEYFQEHCPVDPAKLFVLHNGVRLPQADVGLESETSSGNAIQELRGSFGIGPEQELFGFVGRLTSGKGLEFAFSFIHRLRQSGRDARLLVVGSSGDAQADEAYAARAEAQCPGGVVFAGSQADPYPFYAAFDAFLFPSESWTEAMPGTALEAAAHGLPILSRENPAMREIAGFYDGIVFMADDANPTMMAEQVLQLPMADTSRLRENFSIQAMANKTKALYWELLRTS